MYLAEGEGRKETAGVEAVAAEEESGGRRRVWSLSKADLDRCCSVRRSAMDYAIGRQAGGGSDGRRRGLKFESLMGRLDRLHMLGFWAEVRLEIARDSGSLASGRDGWLVEASTIARMRWTSLRQVAVRCQCVWLAPPTPAPGPASAKHSTARVHGWHGPHP